jgi:hypothetical protein
MLAQAIYPGRCKSIALDKVYEVKWVTDGRYCGIIDDSGQCRTFRKYRFRFFDCESCISRKCNSCPRLSVKDFYLHYSREKKC